MISESENISKNSLDSISPTPPSQQLRPPQITVVWLRWWADMVVPDNNYGVEKATGKDRSVSIIDVLKIMRKIYNKLTHEQQHQRRS